MTHAVRVCDHRPAWSFGSNRGMVMIGSPCRIAAARDTPAFATAPLARLLGVRECREQRLLDLSRVETRVLHHARHVGLQYARVLGSAQDRPPSRRLRRPSFGPANSPRSRRTRLGSTAKANQNGPRRSNDERASGTESLVTRLTKSCARDHRTSVRTEIERYGFEEIARPLGIAFTFRELTFERCVAMPRASP
jgi:hypothetical protein